MESGRNGPIHPLARSQAWEPEIRTRVRVIWRFVSLFPDAVVEDARHRDRRRRRRRFTFKNIVAIGLFLFGTTFLWMTASFTGRTPPPEGGIWTVENILALIAVIGFSAAGWGVFRELAWWETAAVASATVGLIAIIPYVLGLSQIGVGFADPGVQINLAMHVLGSAAVLALVLVPAVHGWLTARLN